MYYYTEVLKGTPNPEDIYINNIKDQLQSLQIVFSYILLFR